MFSDIWDKHNLICKGQLCGVAQNIAGLATFPSSPVNKERIKLRTMCTIGSSQFRNGNWNYWNKLLQHTQNSTVIYISFQINLVLYLKIHFDKNVVFFHVNTLVTIWCSILLYTTWRLYVFSEAPERPIYLRWVSSIIFISKYSVSSS